MKVLFIPSSGTKGSGETLNAFQIFAFLKKKYPSLESKIFLHELSPFIESSPISVITAINTPTRCDDKVIPLIEQFKPNITFFLGAGSKKQIKISKCIGSINIFISFSENLRNRGLRLGRIQHIDLHIVDQYHFLLENLTFLEKIKTYVWEKAKPKYWGPIFNLPTESDIQKTLSKYNLKSSEFILVSVGSGAECDLNGENYSTLIFNSLKNAGLKYPIIQSFGKAYPNDLPKSTEKHFCMNYFEPSEFICLMKTAKLIVTNGGGSLLQAISLNKTSLTCPMVDDQFKRVKICASLNLTEQYEPTNITEQINKNLNTPASENPVENLNPSALNRLNAFIEKVLE